MDYLSDNFSSRKRKITGGNNAIEGELVTPPPDKYTKQKALPNETFIDGQKASTAVGRPNPQIAQTQPTLPKPNALTGDLLAQNPTTFNPKSTQGSVIEGQVLRPTLGTQPVVNTVNPLNTGATATQQLTQMAQKPTMPPYQPATNPVNQYGGMPPNNPPVANTGGAGSNNFQSTTRNTNPYASGIKIPESPTLASRFGNALGKVGAAMPAIQAGMNAANIMNQEANFSNKIHAGSFADPNLGNEVMGSAPKKQVAVPITHPLQVKELQTVQQKQELPTTQIGNQAAISPADTKNKFTGAVESSSQMSPVVAQQPNRIPTLGTKKPEQQTAQTEPKMPTSMNDVTSGTGYIKGGNGAFKDGVGFVQGQGGVLQRSDGKVTDPNQMVYHSADGKGTITSNARPSMRGLSTQADIDVLDRLAAQRESGAITAAQASQIYAQYKQDTAPLDQQPQIAMQRMAAQGYIPAAKQLTDEAQRQATAEYQQGTLANQGRTLDMQQENTQYARNTSEAKLADAKAQLGLGYLKGDPEAIATLNRTKEPEYVTISNKYTDETGTHSQDMRVRADRPYTPSETQSKEQIAAKEAHAKAKIGETTTDNSTGKVYRKIANTGDFEKDWQEM